MRAVHGARERHDLHGAGDRRADRFVEQDVLDQRGVDVHDGGVGHRAFGGAKHAKPSAAEVLIAANAARST
ncbi:hypothetical protein PT2222_290102 [Paraburkholderia tropica]